MQEAMKALKAVYECPLYQPLPHCKFVQQPQNLSVSPLAGNLESTNSRISSLGSRRLLRMLLSYSYLW